MNDEQFKELYSRRSLALVTPTEKERNAFFHKCRKDIERRRNVFNELLAVGPLAALMCGSILIGLDENLNVVPLRESSFKQLILQTSQVFESLKPNQRRKLTHMNYETYIRMERGFQSFGTCICLATEHLHTPSLMKCMWNLKKWYVNHFIRKPDQALTYLKFLGKYCQALALDSDVPDIESYFPFVRHSANGQLTLTDLPFYGDLRFIKESIAQRARLGVEQVRTLVQISSVNRALPYPSLEQVKESIRNTVSIMTSNYRVSHTYLNMYRKAIMDYKGLISTMNHGRAPVTKTHVSVTSSSAYESTKSDGGRAFVAMARIKLLARRPVVLETLVNMQDLMDPYYGVPVDDLLISKVKQYFPNLLKDNGSPLLYGDILYTTTTSNDRLVGLEVIFEQIKSGFITNPPCLQRWLLWEASTNGYLLKRGQYNIEPSIQLEHGFFLYHKSTKGQLKFKLNKPVPVRLALSIESGMKTRLTTSSLAAVTTLLQPLRHIVDNYLSADPSLRVGIEEADKLWEVLKAYRKKNSPK
jgi:hypothetical protein